MIPAISWQSSYTIDLAGVAPLSVDGAWVSEDGSVPAGAFSATQVSAAASPSAMPLGGAGLTVANGPGTIASIPMSGLLRLCFFGECGAAAFELPVPVSAFSGPGAQAFGTGLSAVTVVGAAWTHGLVETAGGLVTSGFCHGPASATSPAGATSFRLVAPIFISTGLQLANLEFVGLASVSASGIVNPEPSTALLLGLGIVGLAWAGARRW